MNSASGAGNKSCDVVVFGDLFIDQVMTGFLRLPGLGEEALASNMRREMGGGAAITACGLGTLGARTKVIGVIGADESDWFRQKLKSKGVQAEALVSHPTKPTAITVAVSTAGDRIFYTYTGANAALPKLLAEAETRRPAALLWTMIATVAWIFLSLTMLILTWNTLLSQVAAICAAGRVSP